MARSVTHVGRRLTRVLMAAAVYTVVEYGIWVTLLLYAYGRGGVALAGLASVVQLLPAAFLAPALGSLGDRLPRGTAICGAYACLALCLAATGALLVTHAPLALVLTAGAAVTTCISVVRPLHYSVLPQLAPTAASLVSANAVTGVLDGIGVFVGDGISCKTGDFGYWLGEPFWGRGIMSEAACAVAPYTMEHFGLCRLEASVFAWNPASMRVLERAGFVKEGISRASVFKDGELIDEVNYALVDRGGG